MLYVKSLNSIYGIIKAEISIYKKFVGNITYFGFKLNPYDPCVENKLISFKRMNVVWNFYDIKVIHESKMIVTRMGKWLKKS